MAHNKPSLWADWRWQRLSRNCLLSNPSKLVDQWQYLSINPSSNGKELARIISHHKACTGLLLRPGIHCIPLRSPQRHDRALASSISGKEILVFSRFQNGLLVGRCSVCWWAPFEWFPGDKRGLGSEAHCRCPPSLTGRTAGRPSVFELACLWPAVCVVSVSCHQCWQCKDLWRLAPLVDHPKNGEAVVGRRSRR